MKRYAIGDIHGCLKTFQAILKQINYSKGDELILLGDYVDRGPDSKGVFDFIFELLEAGHNIVCLRGNHEQILLNSRTEPDVKKSWLKHGGVQTLMSFDVQHAEEIPQKYLDFMLNLPYYYESGNYICVHGGLNFKYLNPFDDEYGMMWERYWYDKVNTKWLGNRIIVHGHTPTQKDEIEDMGKHVNQNQYINLDCGCFMNQRRNDMGFLVAFDLDTSELHFLKCEDEVIF
jgi:serine/threonine protein phosphatase 1